MPSFFSDFVDETVQAGARYPDRPRNSDNVMLAVSAQGMQERLFIHEDRPFRGIPTSGSKRRDDAQNATSDGDNCFGTAEAWTAAKDTDKGTGAKAEACC
jgi:hypothetical protein